MKVLAALSGGVDSSVAAALLADAGHEVVAVTLKLWGGDSDTGCCSVSDVDDARRSADRLGVEHHVWNYAEEFERHVVEPYVEAHRQGITPNPCVECNRHLKFDLLLERAELLGFEAVATGHHARRVQLDDGSWRLARGADPQKDQSYVLHPLVSIGVDRVLFPIGHLTKPQVRAIAADRGLRTASKPDSQDVCFITRASGRASFLGDRIPLRSAPVIDTHGTVVGRTDAVETVTIGQRRGLHLAGGSEPRFVLDVDVDTSTPSVRVGSAQDLLVDQLRLDRVEWAAHPGEVSNDSADGGWGSVTVDVQVSAHGDTAAATVEPLGRDGAVARWSAPHRRVAPGQSVVFYNGDLVVGAGVASRH